MRVYEISTPSTFTDGNPSVSEFFQKEEIVSLSEIKPQNGDGSCKECGSHQMCQNYMSVTEKESPRLEMESRLLCEDNLPDKIMEPQRVWQIQSQRVKAYSRLCRSYISASVNRASRLHNQETAEESTRRHSPRH